MVRAASNLVDRAKGWENHIYLRDFIPIRVRPRVINNAVLRRRYLETKFSAQQLAEQYGVSKQMILARLREVGVHGTKGRGRDPGNYRFRNPTYGYKVLNGRLETNSSEMKIVRLIVELRDRQGWSFARIANELNLRGYRNRKGTEWGRVSARHVHKNWTGKV